MSLFGTSPTEDAPITARSRSTLFDEPAGSGSSLFDDGNEWNLPAPKPQQARGDSIRDIVNNLLKTAHIPDEYIDLFDDLQREEGAATVSALNRLMDSLGIPTNQQDRMLKTLGKSSGDAGPVTRDEFNVFMALAGLQSEGEEELTLDAVDDRKRNLPIPNLSTSIVSSKDSYSPATPRTTSSSLMPSQPTRHSTPPKTISPDPTPRLSQSVDDAADPWGSPELHKNHNHVPNTNGSNYLPRMQPALVTQDVQPNVSRTSRPSYDSMPSHLTDNEDLQSTLRAPHQPSNAWAGPPSSAGGFVDGQTDGPSSTGARAGRFNSSGGQRVNEVITVTSLPEKEGVFMFQHRNYQIASVRRGSRVVRRYSDFVWLLDCLLKRYPFRQLPLLPPKRLAVNGHYLSADNAFIERRRRGLVRFANALVRHPVLKDETLVVMFLTVPTELSVWRKQANLSLQEEFADKLLPAGLEDSLPVDLINTFETVRSGVKRSAETYIQLCNLLERIEKRHEGLAADYGRFASHLNGLTDVSESTYAVDTSEVALLNDGLTSVAKHFSTAESLVDDEIKAWDVGVLEDYKRQRDTLVSMREMFDRKDKYAVDNIPYLEKRIKTTEEKLRNTRAKPMEQQKPGETEKLEGSIIADKESIVRQHARGILIKECVRDELHYFQSSQYHVSKLQQDWAQERIKYAELSAENWRGLGNAVEGMPLGD